MDDALTTIFSALGHSDSTIKNNSTEISTGMECVRIGSGDEILSERPDAKNRDVNHCQIRPNHRTEHLSGSDGTRPNVPGSMFFALARALFLNHGQDSSLALALVAWGEEHEPKAVQFIADNVGDMDKVRRGLGGLARAWIKQDEQEFMMHVAEDEPAWQALTPYVERRPIPEWMGWADRYRKFKLDDLDRKVIERVRSEMDREREAIALHG